MKNILITTGGTGGHVIPAQILGEHLKDKYKINFSTDLRGFKYLNSNENKILVIDTPKLNLNYLFPLKILKIFFLILKSIFYLKKENINKIISTGGYMSLPICLGAKIIGLKIFLLEPNIVLGKANRFYLNFSDKIICYSSDIINFPDKFINKIELIKPLVAKNFYEIKRKEDVNRKFCFLISGGSQGAEIFDEIIKEALVNLSSQYSIKIIQQTNIGNVENLRDFYDKNNIENKIFNFEKNFINLINDADLCITRAGAGSLAEISIMNKPFIAIPLPIAKDNHQMENAKFYEKLGCCWVLEQKDLNKSKLNHILSNIMKNKLDYEEKKNNLKKLNYQSSWNDINQKIKKILYEN